MYKRKVKLNIQSKRYYGLVCYKTSALGLSCFVSNHCASWIHSHSLDKTQGCCRTRCFVATQLLVWSENQLNLVSNLTTEAVFWATFPPAHDLTEH